MHRPSPDQYNPPLTRRAHAWRVAVVVLFSATLWWNAAPAQWSELRALFWLDLSFGLLALAATFLRRRWPFAVAVILSLLGAVSVTANGPAALAKVSLATRRVTWQIVVVGVLDLVPSITIPMIQPERADGLLWIDVVLGLLAAIAMLACGMYIGSRRELLWTLRDRAERAEGEQALRIDQGRSNERARIAREMHDVLAHRISLMSVHAGALAYRTDLSAAEMRHTAQLLQTTSHEALVDLRQVLGVLRDDGTSDARSERPQPTFRDLSALVLEAEGAGMHLQYDDSVSDADAMPDGIGRTAYRIIQEGLTNVRKHAPGVTALVQVSGSPQEGVNIRISNPARSPEASRSTEPPGAGLGLVGLSERAKLAGGTLTTRRDAGSFELTGWLPWTT